MTRMPYTLSVRGWKGYVLGVLLLAATVGLAVLLRPVLEQALFILLVPAVVATAWLSGLRPALLVTLLAVLAVDWLFIPPVQSLGLYHIDSYLAVAILVIVAWSVAWLAHRVHDTLDSLRQRTGELEDRTAQLELARQEARARALEFRSLAENAPDLIARLDSDLRYVYVNPAVERAVGEPGERFVGRRVGEMGLFRSVPALPSIMESTLESGEPTELEFRHRQEGGDRWYGLQLVPESDADGRVRTVLGIAREITEQRRAEESRTLLLEASGLFTSSLEPARTMDTIGRLIARSLGDYCLVDVLDPDGRPVRQVIATEDPDLEEKLQRLSEQHPATEEPQHPILEVIRTGEPLRAERVDEQVLERIAPDPVLRAQLRDLPLGSFMIVPLAGRLGSIGAISIASLGDRRAYTQEDLALAGELGGRAGLALENARLYEQARDEVRLREEILAIVAHDLSNPLNVVRTTAHALRARSEADPERDRMFDAHERAVERADRLLRDLLDLSRIESGRFRIEREITEVETLLDDALEQTRLQSRPPPRWAVHVSADCPPIAVDRGRLVQALCNLIDNAMRFSPEGAVIKLGAERRGGHVVLYLVDQGPGIQPSELPYVFKRFWRGETSPGSGLGLSIVKGIVDAHGGEVQVESTPGEGATFRLLLPVQAGGRDEEEGVDEAAAPAESAADAELAL